MADSTTGYENKWSIGADKEFTIYISNLDVSTKDGYAVHLVYADFPKEAILAKYSLNTVTGYEQHLETVSASATESVIKVKAQRGVADVLIEGRKIDLIFFTENVDASYDENRFMQFGIPAAFATVVKGAALVPSIS